MQFLYGFYDFFGVLHICILVHVIICMPMFFITEPASLSLAYISLTFIGNKGAERVHRDHFK